MLVILFVGNTSPPASLVHRLALRLLIADLEVLRALDRLQAHGFAVCAGQSQRDLLGSFGLEGRKREPRGRAVACRGSVAKKGRPALALI